MIMFSRMTTLVFCSAFLCACQSDYDRTVEDIKTKQFQSELEKLNSVSTAEMETSEARGTKTCHIRQYTSAHLAKKRIDTTTKTVRYYASDMSDVFVRVYRDGSAGIAVTDDTYPGTNAYFLIDGKRYVADGDNYASLDRKAIDALKADPVIKFSWTNWPYRNEVNKDDAIAGFSKSYQQCVDFLNGKNHP